VRDYLETLVKAESILSNDMQRLESTFALNPE
jgi:hypothetical protein